MMILSQAQLSSHAQANKHRQPRDWSLLAIDGSFPTLVSLVPTTGAALTVSLGPTFDATLTASVEHGLEVAVWHEEGVGEGEVGDGAGPAACT